MRETREVSARMVAELGSKLRGEMGHLLTEMIRVVSFCVTAAAQEAGLAGDAVPDLIKRLKDLLLISRRVESAARTSEQSEREIRERTSLEVAGEIADRVSKAAGKRKSVSAEKLREIACDVYGIQVSEERPAKKGISAETVDENRRKILGVDAASPVNGPSMPLSALSSSRPAGAGDACRVRARQGRRRPAVIPTLLRPAAAIAVLPLPRRQSRHSTSWSNAGFAAKPIRNAPQRESRKLVPGPRPRLPRSHMLCSQCAGNGPLEMALRLGHCSGGRQVACGAELSIGTPLLTERY